MINDVVVIDDFLSENDANFLENLATSTKVRWEFCKSSVDNYPSTFSCKIKNSDLTFQENAQFVYPLVWDKQIKSDQYISFLQPMHKIHQLLGYNIDVHRMKLNFLPCFTIRNNTFNSPHVDRFSEIPFFVLIYYVNDSDGGTILFNERSGLDIKDKAAIDLIPKEYTIKDIVQPKKNRAVLFSGDRFHCNQPPVTSNYRIVINYNFYLT